MSKSDQIIVSSTCWICVLHIGIGPEDICSVWLRVHDAQEWASPWFIDVLASCCAHRAQTLLCGSLRGQHGPKIQQKQLACANAIRAYTACRAQDFVVLRLKEHHAQE